MKVIALKDRRTYIAEVDHTELEKAFDKYYGGLDGLVVGSEIDLGEAHDFSVEAKDALQKTRDFIQANEKVVRAILNGLSFEMPATKKVKKT
jgi:hypothetical protein